MDIQFWDFLLTLGEVAAASRGRSPPQAVIRLSHSWEEGREGKGVLYWYLSLLTLGEVAAASRGRSPPQAVIRLSHSWEEGREGKGVLYWYLSLLTLGEVAAASRGSSPPQAVIRLSHSWEIMCVTFTTKMWFSAALTKSITVLVLCLKSNIKIMHMYISKAFCY